MAKNKKIIYWVIGIVILLLILNSFGIFKTTFFSIESTSIKFRTSNFYYGITPPEYSSIAYTNTCGNELTRYEVYTESGSQTENCNTIKGFIGESLIYLFDVPGKITTNGVDDGKEIIKTYLYKGDLYNLLYVCSDYTAGGSHTLSYMINEAPTILPYPVSTSPTSINSSKEVGCPSCNTPADTNCDNTVDRDELGSYITNWVIGIVTRDNLGQAIVAWVGGG